MRIGEWTHDEFMDRAAAFHGYPAPGLIIGGYMVELARRALPEGILFDALSETGHCLPDAVQLLTPCTFGNGWLRVLPFGLYAVSLYNKYTGEGVRVHLDTDKLGPWPEIRAWFLKEKAKKDQDTERLQAEIRSAGSDILTLRPVRVRSDRLGHKSSGPVVRCPLCGEYYPAAHGGLCRSCQGESPYEAGPGAAFPAPRLRAVPVEQAVGGRALHDMTRIVPGEEKGPAFRAGQTISAGDVCRLQQMGRTRIYLCEDAEDLEDWVHEDEAARRFAELMPGDGVTSEGRPGEGKINFRAEVAGLLVLEVERLERFNLVPDVMCAARRNFSLVESGARVAATRAVPLYLSRQALIRALAVLDEGPLFRIAPLRRSRIGVLVTGTEVFQGLIQDRFAPVIARKAEALHCEVVKTVIAPDDAAAVGAGVRELLDAGAEVVVTTAGLSVDPDDVTRKALLEAGLEDALYGVAALPGTMSLVGRIGAARVIGVPACALFYKTTAFDLLFPRLLADLPITRRDLARLGNGGLCMECRICTFPKCPFGGGA